MMEKIIVVGLGYVGLTVSVGLSELGHKVIGIDTNKKKIEELNRNKSPIYEKNMQKYIEKNSKNLKFSTDLKSAMELSNIIYICVPTPEKENGEAELKYVYQVINTIISYINKDTYIIIKSTVPVGTCNQIEEYISKKILKSIKVEIISNPEFLCQGTAISDFLYPQRIVLGVKSKNAELLMKKIYKKIDSRYIVTDRKTSEMIKYSSNSFLALKLSYINEIANLCEKVSVNIEDLIKGIGTDKRIGKEFLEVGIGYGGACLPKDTKALSKLANNNQMKLETIDSAIKVNKSQNFIMLEKSRKYYKNLNNVKVAILGVTFKTNTDDLRNSLAIENIKKMLCENANITVYDYRGIEELKKRYGNAIKYAETIETSIENAEICFIFNKNKEIKETSLKKFEEKMANAIILDGRNCFKIKEAEKYKIIYESVGRKIINNLK